ncbi:bifunctional hydroxymethylpyrimidine kinase/phosphomethylpyrimidine kinase [Halegenticoccus tardaugens]|uniref:bifunctional hydroxymethylpyrimidine kinase/phosphomethylpyrimidine kinase n=1 Tax=Halegenticoccus tardaugens TaxID=2071624 RepID=UPI00100A284D|nr:bifunctional hydroxymethylpyrimidine kinase/phosphomethylpyrimidine kinase [Halegenticoccus tardaugens]
MRRPAPVSPPIALTVAGSDSGGGAGIQADLKTMEAHGVFGTSVVTATTAQNTRGVRSSFVLPVEEIRAQYEAVADDFEIGAVKTGMLATSEVIGAVTDLLSDFDGPIVVDPVMVAATGDRLLDEAAEAAYGGLLAAATLATPNADEAAALTGIDVVDAESAREAGEALLETGVDAALVKGGHVDGDVVVDTLVSAAGAERFEHPRIDTDANHGSGCTLASAVAARLARGESLDSAVAAGVGFMERAVRYSLDVGEGPGAVHHLVALREEADRHQTIEAVEGVVRRLVDRDASALVPEVGMNVVGATPYAETVSETAAVEGRIARTLSGARPNRGVRLGASGHVARFLLACREFDPSLRFAVNCRFDDDVEAALSALSGPVGEFDRSEEPTDVKEREGDTVRWGARRAFEGVAEEAEDVPAGPTPVAVVDRGGVGKEAIVTLLAPDADALADRTLALLDAVEGEGR